MPIIFLLLAIVAFPSFQARAADWEEIPVTQVFIPESGYDDNDDVGLVTDGLLPDACYSVGPVRIEVLPQRNTIRVHQMALRNRTGYCLGDRPVVLKRPVPFTREASVGLLKPGQYSVEFLTRNSVWKSRKFGVAPAADRSVDSLPYALVTGVEQPDYVRVSEDVRPVLTGTLTSRCARLNPNVPVQKQGDVFVILPTQEFDTELPGECPETKATFQLPLDLGPLATGRYLLHVRSMNGRAVNKVFGVFDDSRGDPPGSGR